MSIAKLISGIVAVVAGLMLLVQTGMAGLFGRVTKTETSAWVWGLLAALLFIVMGSGYLLARSSTSLTTDWIAVGAMIVATMIGIGQHAVFVDLRYWAIAGLVISGGLLVWHWTSLRQGSAS